MDTSKELTYRLYMHKETDFKRSTLESEFSHYDDVKNGDIDKVVENFNAEKDNYSEGKGVLSDNPLHNHIYHLVVSAGIISRLCIDEGMPQDEAFTLSDIYIRKADKAKTVEEVVALVGELQMDYATRMRARRKDKTVSIHIRRSIDYIYDNLNKNLTMAELAEKQGLNPSYFSKLFAKETGTTVKSYIINAKIDTAKNMLEYSEYSLTDIALALGFSSQSALTAEFKKITGMTPGKYRAQFNYKSIKVNAKKN